MNRQTLHRRHRKAPRSRGVDRRRESNCSGYITDTGNHRIRAVTVEGEIRTLSLRRFSPTGDEYALGRDGTQVITTKQADPRFGPSVAHPERVEITTPAGLTAILESELSVTPPGISDPAQLLEWQETTTLNGRESSLHFDAATRVFTTTSAAGRSAQMTVDAQRRPLHLASAGLAEVDYSYDPRGRLIGITQSDGLTTRAYQFGYDANGYLDQVTDPLNRTVQIENDLDGRPTLLTLPDNREIALTSDANGNVTTLTTPKQDVHIFGYDALDRENRYEAPAMGTPTVTETDYDLEGNVQQQRLPGDINLNFGYDAGGRLTAVSRPEQDGDAGNDVELTYAYDGFLTTQETASGTIEGRIGYGYDADFRIEELTVSEAEPATAATTVSYGYDADGLLTEAASAPEPGLGPATTLTLTRDPQHGLLTGTHAGLVEDTWTWNAYAEPSAYSASINAAPILELSYERDLLGRITRKTETIQGVSTETDYTYDLAGRLQRVEIGGALEEEYVYDANGNRLTVTPGQGNPIAATYDAQDRLLTHGACTFTYTANGELKTKTCGADTTHYTYTALGDLTAVEQPDGTLIEYVVDGRGRRVGKRVDGNLVQGFLYLNQLEPSAELDQNGAIVATFVYADKAHVPSLMHKGGKTYRYLTDHLGSPRLIVDIQTGDIAQRLDYDAWGQVILDTNPGFQPFGYAGGIYDRDIGFVRFGARDYDPIRGRWHSKEPLGFAGSLNWYVYVDNDPINVIDIDGRLPSLPDWMVSGGAGIGDALLFGFGDDLRNAFNVDGGVDPCSTAYGVGQFIGENFSPNGRAAKGGKVLRMAARGGAKTPITSGAQRAGKTGTPNSIYEQMDNAGRVRSRTFYDKNGRPFSRQDFDHSHGGIKPHEHNRLFDANGRPITSETVRPVPPGYGNTPSGSGL